MLYLLIICICSFIIILLNSVFFSSNLSLNFLQITLLTIVCVIVQIILDSILALIGRRCFPNKWFGVDNKKFCAKPKERRFYEKIGIKKWKDKILELGALSGFRKNKIKEPKNNEYIAKYILEANYGVLVHVLVIVFGFSLAFIFPRKYFLSFCLPVSIVNAVLNLLPLFVLKYNLPKLFIIYKLNNKKLSENKELKHAV